MSATPADAALAAALDSELLGPRDTSAILIDLDVLSRQAARIRDAFPASAHHAVAVKSNPLGCVLAHLAELGHFAEAASAEELLLAGVVGFEGRTVWDSPAKTVLEIEDALEERPWLINVDSFAELERYPDAGLRLGLRVNPENAPDTIASLATGVAGSKFGIRISERERIIDAFVAEPQLTALHVHSGSNSRSLDPMVDGIANVVELAVEINERIGSPRIDTIDIGGGLPWTEEADEALSVERYAELLRRRAPRLFTDEFRIVTEFGRLYHLGAGTTATRIEYVKRSADTTTAVVHVGADSFVREVYDSENWSVAVRTPASDLAHVADPHEVADARVADARVDVAGPLCFEGDFLVREASGLQVSPGGWLMIDRTGANTFSLWSRHCSRAMPAVLLFEGEDPSGSVRVGKPRESRREAIATWL